MPISLRPPGGRYSSSVKLKKIVTCACGYEARGCDDEIVRIMQQHGRDVHNMDATAEQILAMARDWDDAPPDVEGPVQAEIFVVRLDDGQLVMTGPCGAEPWYMQVGAGADPLDAVAETVRRVVDEPLVVHSTSWRQDRDAVVLTFVAVISRPELAAVPVPRAELARGGATAAPERIGTFQVLEHALRHLAWLVHDDPEVSAKLGARGWAEALRDYTPEPFRHLR
jgi:predicted small metal-binding protein